MATKEEKRAEQESAEGRKKRQRAIDGPDDTITLPPRSPGPPEPPPGATRKHTKVDKVATDQSGKDKDAPTSKSKRKAPLVPKRGRQRRSVPLKGSFNKPEKPKEQKRPARAPKSARAKKKVVFKFLGEE